jgi:hypothetical protein
MGDILQPTHLIIVAVMLTLYFVPVFVARSRKCSATAGIAIINIFLGWTFLGWVVALTWAAVGKTRTAATV